MADQVSLLASVLALSTASMQAGKALLSVSSTYYGYEDQTIGLATGLRLLSQTLLEFHEVVDVNPKLISTRALSNTNEILEGCQRLLNEVHRMVGKFDNSNVPKWWQRVGWQVDREEALLLRTRLESFKSTLTMLLSTMHLAKVKQARLQTRSSEQLKSKKQLLRGRVEREIIVNTYTIERQRSIELYQQSTPKTITINPDHNIEWLLGIIPTFDRPLSIYPSNPLLPIGSPGYEDSLEIQQRDDRKKVKKAVLVLLSGWTTLDLSQNNSTKNELRQNSRQPEVLIEDEAATLLESADKIRSTNNEPKSFEISLGYEASIPERSISKPSNLKSHHRSSLFRPLDGDLDKVSTTTSLHSKMPDSPAISSSTTSEENNYSIDEGTNLFSDIPPSPKSHAMARLPSPIRYIHRGPKRSIYPDYHSPGFSQPGADSFLAGANGLSYHPDSHMPISYNMQPLPEPYVFQSTPWHQQQPMNAYHGHLRQQYPQFRPFMPLLGPGLPSTITWQNDRPPLPSNLTPFQKHKTQSEEAGETNMDFSLATEEEDRKRQELKLIVNTNKAVEEFIEKERTAFVIEAAKEAAKLREKARREDWIKGLSASTSLIGHTESSLFFTSTTGSKYRLPFQRCNHWKDMRNSILMIHAAEGIELESDQDSSYALFDSTHQIILPDFWEDLVHPGMVCSLEICKASDDKDNDAEVAEENRKSGLDRIRVTDNHIVADQIPFVQSSNGLRSNSTTRSHVGKPNANLESSTSAVKSGRRQNTSHKKEPKSSIRPNEVFLGSDFDTSSNDDGVNTRKSLRIGDGTSTKDVVANSNKSKNRSFDEPSDRLWLVSNNGDQNIPDHIKQDLSQLTQKNEIASTGSNPMSDHVMPFENKLWQDSNLTWAQNPPEARQIGLRKNLEGTTFVTSPRSETAMANHHHHNHPKAAIEQQIEHLSRLMQREELDKPAQRAAVKQAHDEARLKRLEDTILSMTSENPDTSTLIPSNNTGFVTPTAAKFEAHPSEARDTSENAIAQKKATVTLNESFPEISKSATSVTTRNKPATSNLPVETRKRSFRRSIFQRFSSS